MKDAIKLRYAKFTDLQDRFVKYGASDAVESDIYFSMAGNTLFQESSYKYMWSNSKRRR